ncbi:MAG: hypothetical protein ACREJ3_19260 [Polyangiaceae bacterium]
MKPPRLPGVLLPSYSPLVKVALAVLASIGVLAQGRVASAADMDPTPERLFMNPPGLPAGVGCQQVAANPEIVLHPPFPASASPNSYGCQPNNVAWANMMSELGMAIAPTAFHPARTTGLGGFALSFEASYTHINADATAGGVQYWHQGTQGPIDPTTKQFSVVNTSPDSLLQIYSLKARKGLAYGFEVTGALGYVANTSLWVGGGDLHWAILEGYRTGFLGYLPDIAIGGGVRTLGGSPKLFLTTIGMDAQISKPFTLDDSAVVTPYLGAQRVIIFADSPVVDLAPNVDPLQQCGYEGTNVPGNPNGHAPFDGRPVCQNKLSNGADNNSAFNNDTTFQKARIHRWRGIAGVNYKYEVLYLAAQFAFDMEDPSDENANLGITGARQWTTSLEAGVYF